MEFTFKYGLLGFVTAIPLNGNFMEYSNVFFGRNGFFDVDFMETKDYLQVFQPFGIKEGQLKTGFTMLPALIGKTLKYEIVFSRNYAERTDWLFGVISEFYTYFAACAAYTRRTTLPCKTITPILFSASASTAGFPHEDGRQANACMGFRFAKNGA